jgi:hypothetical protein
LRHTSALAALVDMILLMRKVALMRQFLTVMAIAPMVTEPPYTGIKLMTPLVFLGTPQSLAVQRISFGLLLMTLLLVMA